MDYPDWFREQEKIDRKRRRRDRFKNGMITLGMIIISGLISGIIIYALLDALSK